MQTSSHEGFNVFLFRRQAPDAAPTTLKPLCLFRRRSSTYTNVMTTMSRKCSPPGVISRLALLALPMIPKCCRWNRAMTFVASSSLVNCVQYSSIGENNFKDILHSQWVPPERQTTIYRTHRQVPERFEDSRCHLISPVCPDEKCLAMDSPANQTHWANSWHELLNINLFSIVA